MISLEISDDADKEWNKRLEKSGLGTTSQIKEAATFTKFKNQKPVFLQFIDSTGKIVAQLLLSEFSRFESQPHKIKPSKKRIVANKFFKKIPGITKNVYRWSYGPLIFDSEKSAEVYEKLNSFLLSKGNQVSGWEHPLSHSHAHLLKKFKLIPWSTYIIDLNLPVDSLYENLEKHNCRKNIERSQKRDVIIEEINETNLKEYFDLRQQNKEMGGKKNEFDFLLQRWRMLKPIGQSGFLARWKDKPVGGLLFTFHSGYILESAVARSEIDFKNKLYSQDLIRWNIIKWGVKNNMKYYDLAGFNPVPKSKKEIGIQRYKKKWGGKKYDFYNILKQ